MKETFKFIGIFVAIYIPLVAISTGVLKIPISDVVRLPVIPTMSGVATVILQIDSWFSKKDTLVSEVHPTTSIWRELKNKLILKYLK